LALVAVLLAVPGAALAATPAALPADCVHDTHTDFGCDEGPKPPGNLDEPTSVKIVSFDGYSEMPSDPPPLWGYALAGVGAVALVALATGLTRTRVEG
jgi:hypothetical protein